MSEEDVLEQVAWLFQVPRDQIRRETPRSAVKTWDSLGVLSLIAWLDETFGVLIGDEEIRSMQSVADILACLRTRGKLD